MKVLHINFNHYQSSLYHNFSKHLIKNNCDVRVYHPSMKKNKTHNKPEYLDHDPILGKYDRYFFRSRNRKVTKHIKQVYDFNNIDVIHAHSLFSNGNVAYDLKREFGIPYIVAVRDTDINHFFKERIPLRKTGIKILEAADKIIFLSKPYKNQLLNQYIPDSIYEGIEQKIEVIPNGIEEFWHDNKNKIDKQSVKNKIQVISVGAISKRKNQLSSARACEHLIQSKGMNIELVIVGKIKEQDYYKKLTRYNFIKYIPHQTKDELLNLYRDSDVFLMPSITETFGLVYAEAMSQGLPVLYSKGQGFDKQFQDGTVGYSVNSLDSKDIAKKIKNVIENRDYLSENSLKLVDVFSWEKISKQYIKIYTELAS